MGISFPSGSFRKFRIMLQPKAIQPRIGLLRRIQTRQTHLSHQTRLQRAETALHSPFRLRGQRVYRCHIQSAQNASELGELVARVLRSRQLERAMAIGIQATRAPP